MSKYFIYWLIWFQLDCWRSSSCQTCYSLLTCWMVKLEIQKRFHFLGFFSWDCFYVLIRVESFLLFRRQTRQLKCLAAGEEHDSLLLCWRFIFVFCEVGVREKYVVEKVFEPSSHTNSSEWNELNLPGPSRWRTIRRASEHASWQL